MYRLVASLDLVLFVVSLCPNRSAAPRWLTIVFIVGTVVTAARPAVAEVLAVEARGGFGYASMVSQWQRDQGYKVGFVPDLRPGLRLDSSMAAELALQSWFFPRPDGAFGRASLFGAGARWDPRLLDWLTWFVDGHAGVALTGPVNRFMFDLGTGFDLAVTEILAVGPFLRYGHIVGSGADPRFWSVGLGLTVAWAVGEDPAARERHDRQRMWERAREREQRDRDNDGVPDGRDNCPDEPGDARPGSKTPGCPRQERRVTKPVEARPAAPDNDGDGIPNRDDKCPDRSFGKYPDPMSMGCPLPDRDQDGIPDDLDACPSKRGSPSTNQRKNGCP